MKKSYPFYIYSFSIFIIGIIGFFPVLISNYGAPRLDWSLLIIIPLFFATRILSFTVGPKILVSLAFTLGISVTVFYGPVIGSLASLATYLTQTLFEDRKGLQVILIFSIITFNCGMEVFINGIGGVLFNAMHPSPIIDISDWTTIAQIILTFLIFKIVNESLLIVGQILRGTNINDIREGVTQAFLVEGATLPIAIIILFLLQVHTMLPIILFSLMILAGSKVAKQLSYTSNQLRVSNIRLEQRVQDLQGLEKSGRAISSEIDLDSIFLQIHRIVTGLMKAPNFSVALMDHTRNLVCTKLCIVNGIRQADFCISADLGLVGNIMKTKAPLRFNYMPIEIQGTNLVPDYTDKYFALSWLGVPVLSENEIMGVIVVQSEESDVYNEDSERLLLTIANQVAVAIRNAMLHKDIQDAFLQSLLTIADILDARDSYTAGHSKRVADISTKISEKLYLSPKEVENVKIGALLHDIGKIGIRDFILLKPSGLDDEEFEEMKAHTIHGARMLEHITRLKDSLPGILYHHEFWNGNGYPEGLSGEDIPLIGRIISVADAFDTMTSDRIYKKGKQLPEALEELKRYSGSQFDPSIAKIILEIAQESPEILKTVPKGRIINAK